MMLRVIFELERKNVTRGWKGLHTEESHNFYSSANIIWVYRSTGMRLAKHEAQTGELSYVQEGL
jgi:hypothetical protein